MNSLHLSTLPWPVTGRGEDENQAAVDLLQWLLERRRRLAGQAAMQMESIIEGCALQPGRLAGMAGVGSLTLKGCHESSH